MPPPPLHLLERRSDALARFRARLATNVWDAAKLEGSPLSMAEVESILSGEPVPGADEFDVDHVRALRDGFAVVADLVQAGAFRLDKWTSDAVHRTVVRFEAIESGHFRGEGHVDGGGAVSLGQGATFQASAPGAPVVSPFCASMRRSWHAWRVSIRASRRCGTRRPRPERSSTSTATSARPD